MADTISAPFPLHSVSTEQLQKLGQYVWNWTLCGSCYGKIQCDEAACSWSRSKQVQTFWDWYSTLTEAYVPEFAPAKPALSSHEDLLNIIQIIRDHPDVERGQLLQEQFSDQRTNAINRAVLLDQNRAMNIAGSVLFLTNCGTSYDCADFLEDGGSSITWHDNIAAGAFIAEAYPTNIHQYFDPASQENKTLDILAALTAPKLLNADFELEPTNDLRSHLTIDYSNRRRVVRVFHCSAVLKEVLLASQIKEDACLLPRPLVLAALHTLYHVLFPQAHDSQAVLSYLVRKHHFDSDLLQYELARFRRKGDTVESYKYFGTRLAAIYDEIHSPTPRTTWENWFQKYSAQRYTLMVTALGIMIAVVLGFLSLVVAVFQAWVGYQQWRHPVKAD